MTPVHRKTMRHYNEPGHAHLMTFSCYRRMPILTNDTWRTWLSERTDIALQQHRFQLIAFVYMPQHVHLLVLPREESYRIDRLSWAIKRPFAYRVAESLRATNSPLLERLTVRERPGVTCFRYWQEGGGHDRNMIAMESLLQAVDYIHENPVRRGFCTKPGAWRWSSWRHYNRPDDPPDPALPKIDGLPAP